MKTVGLIMLTLDLLSTLYTSDTNVIQERVEGVEESETTKDTQHPHGWQAYVGMGMMVVGGIFLMLEKKKSLTV